MSSSAPNRHSRRHRFNLTNTNDHIRCACLVLLDHHLLSSPSSSPIILGLSNFNWLKRVNSCHICSSTDRPSIKCFVCLDDDGATRLIILKEKEVVKDFSTFSKTLSLSVVLDSARDGRVWWSAVSCDFHRWWEGQQKPHVWEGSPCVCVCLFRCLQTDLLRCSYLPPSPSSSRSPTSNIQNTGNKLRVKGKRPVCVRLPHFVGRLSWRATFDREREREKERINSMYTYV